MLFRGFRGQQIVPKGLRDVQGKPRDPMNVSEGLSKAFQGVSRGFQRHQGVSEEFQGDNKKSKERFRVFHGISGGAPVDLIDGLGDLM